MLYRTDPQARLTFVRAVSNPGFSLPCWTLLNFDPTGKYIFMIDPGHGRALPNRGADVRGPDA